MAAPFLVTRQQVTLPSKLQVAPFTFAFASPSTPICKRFQPPRGKKWEVQRIRLMLQGGGTVFYTGLHGVAQNTTGQIATTPGTLGGTPLAGVWINNIAGDTELLWVPAVPPGRSDYAPQIPDLIHENDALLVGVADGFFSGATAGWSITFTLDTIESDDVY